MKRILGLIIASILMLFTLPSYAEEGKDYLVMFKDDVVVPLSCQEVIEPVAEEWNIYKITEEELSSLDMSTVESIQEDYLVELFDYAPNDPLYSYQKIYADIVNVPYVWKNNLFGENVKVGIVDSGINDNHEDLKNNIAKAVDYVESGTIIDEMPHGSSVAGVIAAEINNGIGVAGVSQADLYMYKVFKGKNTSVSYIIEAFADAVNVDNCDVVNMSVGVEFNDSQSSLNNKDIFKEAIDKACEKGVIVIAAAGNSGDQGNPVMYPAGFDNVISVAAIGEDEKYTFFSEYNDKVDVAAPGMFVYTTDNDGYDYVNGTSFAAPHVAGTAAVVKKINPDINQKTFETMIKLSSKDAGDIGYDIHYGWGILNIEKLVKMAENTLDNIYINDISYDKESDKVSVSYHNSGRSREDEIHIRLAVYDENDMLIKLSDKKDLDIEKDQGETYEFTQIDIPKNGYIKIFAMSNSDFLTPVLDVVKYFG